MIDSLKPGQTIRCTVTKNIRTASVRSTVLRLMRLDPDIKRALRHAQKRRAGRLIIRSRGGRPWTVRERSAKLAKAELGESWTMTWVPHVAPDFKNIEQYVKIEKA